MTCNYGKCWHNTSSQVTSKERDGSFPGSKECRRTSWCLQSYHLCSIVLWIPAKSILRLRWSGVCHKSQKAVQVTWQDFLQPTSASYWTPTSFSLMRQKCLSALMSSKSHSLGFFVITIDIIVGIHYFSSVFCLIYFTFTSSMKSKTSTHSIIPTTWS